jgi:glucosamine--fructose-6-phosphate aminotransferase (isomerizing)
MLAGSDQAQVVGRGFGYATAREWALKLKELAGILPDPYSAADMEHGPVEAARLRGHDREHPRHLSKVTRTR